MATPTETVINQTARHRSHIADDVTAIDFDQPIGLTRWTGYAYTGQAYRLRSSKINALFGMNIAVLVTIYDLTYAKKLASSQLILLHRTIAD